MLGIEPRTLSILINLMNKAICEGDIIPLDHIPSVFEIWVVYIFYMYRICEA
jgi:hypothetical protein